MFGYMQSVTDKAVLCDSLFSRNWRVVLVPLSTAPIFFSLVFGQRSQDDGQILLSRIGIWARSLRLAASFVNNRCRGGRRRSRGGRERGRESETRGWGLWPRPPRGAAWILQTRVRARSRAAVPRGVRKEHKRNCGGSWWWTEEESKKEAQTAENNQVCNRLPLPPKCGYRPRRDSDPRLRGSSPQLSVVAELTLFNLNSSPWRVEELTSEIQTANTDVKCR